MELDPTSISDMPYQPICLDCNFWQGFEPYMDLPEEMTHFTPEMENDNFDLYLLNQQ